jgi:hypothetical protein
MDLGAPMREGAPMSNPEIAQSKSDAGRRAVDGFLVTFIVVVAAVVGLGGSGVL